VSQVRFQDVLNAWAATRSLVCSLIRAPFSGVHVVSRAPAFRVDGHLSTNSGGGQQISKACEARAFEGSNPSATATLTGTNAGYGHCVGTGVHALVSSRIV
jgi:hypothetical protein